MSIQIKHRQQNLLEILICRERETSGVVHKVYWNDKVLWVYPELFVKMSCFHLLKRE